MLPAERGDVGEQRVRRRLAAAAQSVDGSAEVHRVPQRDGGGDEGEAAGAVLLQLGGAVAQPPEPGTLERAALLRRRDLGIGPEAWEEAEASLGWIDALVALVVVDRNRDHPTAPVRNPGGLLRDLARRRRAGTLDLGASVMGIWRREEGGGSVAPRKDPEAP